jgi:hypothetical protein
METIYFIVAVHCNALKTIILINTCYPISETDITNSAKHAKKCCKYFEVHKLNNSFVSVI